jgi:hypothetical protein
MPLDASVGFSAAMQAIVDSGHYESHDTLSIVFKDGTVRHYANARDLTGIEDVAEFGTVDFLPDLRDLGTLDEALTLEVDSIEISIANTDSGFSSIALGGARTLNGALGVLGTVLVGDGGTTYWQEIMRGELFNASDPDPDAKATLVSDLTVPGPVAADRALQQHCTIPKYKGAGCSSVDPTATCSRLLDDENGCRAKLPAAAVVDGSQGNDARFQGFVYRIKPLSGTPLQDPGGAIDRGGDFNTYRRGQELAGGYYGRNYVPVKPLGL